MGPQTEREEEARRPIGRFLLMAGMVIGILGIVGVAFDVQRMMPEWMWRIEMLKLVLAESGGLMLVGASLARRARGRTRQLQELPEGEALPVHAPTPEEARVPREARGVDR